MLAAAVLRKRVPLPPVPCPFDPIWGPVSNITGLQPGLSESSAHEDVLVCSIG